MSGTLEGPDGEAWRERNGYRCLLARAAEEPEVKAMDAGLRENVCARDGTRTRGMCIAFTCEVDERGLLHVPQDVLS